MFRIVHSSGIPHIHDWHVQLADLTRRAWTGPDGKCYFPYLPLTTPDEWRTNVLRQWVEGTMHSWVGIVDGRIVNHAALVNKGTHWELGRLVAYNAPRGTTLELCQHRLAWCFEEGIQARMECTQAHTRAQELAVRCGMRFAGIGFLDQIDGVHWDIVYFDTFLGDEFSPWEAGVLANPLAQVHPCTFQDRAHLRRIASQISTDRGGVLPPTRFHILPRLAPILRWIIELNT